MCTRWCTAQLQKRAASCLTGSCAAAAPLQAPGSGNASPQQQQCKPHLDAGQRLQHALQVVLRDGSGRRNLLVRQRLGVVEQHEHRHLWVGQGQRRGLTYCGKEQVAC